MNTAFVLGAGGAAGWVYHAGVAMTLRDELGFDPGSSPLLLGTSAGAAVAASLAGGTSPEAMVEAVMEGPTQEQRAEYMQIMAERQRSFRPMSPSLARNALPGGNGVGVAVSGLLPSGWFPTFALGRFIGVDDHSDWPANRGIPAVNAETGDTEVFGRDRRDLSVAAAVEASSAVPAMFEPKHIGGHRFVDGGTASPTHAHLAAGVDPDLIVVSSPMTRPSKRPMSVLARRRLARERDELSTNGHRVLVVQPDEHHRETFKGFPRRQPERATRIVEIARRATLEALAQPAIS